MTAFTVSGTVTDSSGHTAPWTASATIGAATPARGIGVYMSGNNTGLDAYTTGWAKKPNVASFYFNWNSTVSGTPLVSTYAAQGRTIQLSLSTRISTATYVTWANIAAGTYDAKLVTFIQSLDALGVPVLLSLDVEPDGQYQAGGSNPGVAQGQTPAQYVAAANRVADLIHANSTRVQSDLWLAGFQSAAVSASFLPAHAKLDNVGWDPYSTGSNTAAPNPIDRWAIFINSVLIPNGYADTPRRLHETGIKTDPFTGGGQYTTADQIAFYQNVPAAMDALAIRSAVWFRANSGAHNYIPTDPSVDTAFRDMLVAST